MENKSASSAAAHLRRCSQRLTELRWRWNVLRPQTHFPLPAPTRALTKDVRAPCSHTINGTVFKINVGSDEAMYIAGVFLNGADDVGYESTYYGDITPLGSDKFAITFESADLP